jgi:hypothetical protein
MAHDTRTRGNRFVHAGAAVAAVLLAAPAAAQQGR